MQLFQNFSPQPGLKVIKKFKCRCGWGSGSVKRSPQSLLSLRCRNNEEVGIRVYPIRFRPNLLIVVSVRH